MALLGSLLGSLLGGGDSDPELPVGDPWDLLDVDESSIAEFLGLGTDLVEGDPALSPFFTYLGEPQRAIRVFSDNTAAALNVFAPVSGQFTVELVVRFDQLPNSTGDTANARAGIVVADDASRGVAIYFAKTGLAVSRVNDPSSITTLPDTTDLTREASEAYKVVRVAVDATLGRAYVYIGDASPYNLRLRFIVPIGFSSSVSDIVQLFVKGTASNPVSYRIKAFRLSSQLVGFNPPPVAVGGPDRVVPVGSTTRLDGRGSYSPGNAPLTYSWRLIDVPDGSQYSAHVSGGSTTVQEDGFTNTLSVDGDIPGWLGYGDILLIQGTSHVILSADSNTIVVTTDTIPDSFTNVPFRVLRSAVLLYADTATPVVVPDVQGAYRFELTVNDGLAFSEPAPVLVNVIGARAPLGVEPDLSAMWGMLGDEWRFVKGRGVFQEAWTAVAQLLGSMMLEAWQYHYNFSLRDTQSTFQRRWLPQTTLVTDGKADPTLVHRRGSIAYVPFPAATNIEDYFGTQLIVEYLVDGVVQQLVLEDEDMFVQSPALTNIGIFFVNGYTDAEDGLVYIELFSSTTSFRLSPDSTFGLLDSTDWNTRLRGRGGAGVTDRVYRTAPNTDLTGVSPGDYLVLDGESYRIERVLRDPAYTEDIWDNYDNWLLLSDTLPAYPSPLWEIPGMLLTGKDYSAETVRPGDTAILEAYDAAAGTTVTTHNTVVAVRGDIVLLVLDLALRSLTVTDIYAVGIQRRSRFPLRPGTLSVPRLQDKIAVAAEPRIWEENLDYVVEGDRYGESYIEFRTPFTDDVPLVLWAELTILSNDENIESTFGRIAGLTLENARRLGPDFNYLAGVSGLFYAQQRGPSVDAMRGGAQILLGQPFAEVAGRILEIQHEFSPQQGRILIQDADGYDPPQSEVVRTYLYRKDPLDTSDSSGLALNPETNAPWAAGDDIPQFRPIGAGVTISDIYNEPDWYYPLVRAGMMSELEKFHTFLVRFNLDLVTTANMDLLVQFMQRTKPHITKPILLGGRLHEDDLDVLDTIDGTYTLTLHDSPSWDGPSYYFDEVRGDGTYWNHYDGTFRSDELADLVIDIIDIDFILEWPGGAILAGDCPYGGDLLFETDVIDVDGTLGPPGGIITLDPGDVLPAGTYRFTSAVKSAGVLPELN